MRFFSALALLLLFVAATPRSSAYAQCSDEACVSVDTSLATVSTSDSDMLDALFNSMLGTGSAVDLTLAQHQALASGTVDLTNVLASLNTLGVGTTADSALTTAAPLTVQLQALANAAQTGGNTAAANALNTLRVQAAAGGAGTTNITLGDLFNLDSRTLNQSAKKLNILDLVNAEAGQVNIAKNVTSGTTSLTGSQVGLSVNVSTVGLSVVILEPGKFVCGPTGTQFYGASMRVRAHVALTGLSTPLTIPGLLSAQLNLTGFDVIAAVARSTGTLGAIDDLLGTIQVSARPGIAALYIGSVDDTAFFDRTTPIDPTNELQPGNIAQVKLDVLFLSANVQVLAKGYADGAASSDSILSFTGPYPQVLTASAGSSFAANLVDTLLGNLQITIGPLTGSLGIVGAALTTILNDTLTLVTSTLKSTGGLLGTTLKSVVTGPLDTVLGSLGVKLGQVKIKAEAPYPVLSGMTCNDTAFCTVNDVCNGSGTCAGTARDCSDALGCTTDGCNETTDLCTHTLQATSCNIGGACVASGTASPTNSCLVCNPAVSQTAYVAAAVGTSCNDGQFCTQVDTCNAIGVCGGTVRSCSDGLSCTTDVCNEINDVCVNAPLTGCVINGACVAAGTDDPTNNCMTCNPLVSATAYSAKLVGSACDDGQFCTITDLCNGSGTCTGLARDCGDLLGCTSDACSESTDQCVHAVSAGCAIAGLCIPAGIDDPLNPCMTCNPAVSTSAFTAKTVGTACDDGQFCTVGDACRAGGVCGGSVNSCSDALSCTSDACNELLDVCVNTTTTGCTINGACIAAGAADPANPCMACNPAVSTALYTPRAAGASCDDGLYCTQVDSCNGLGLCTGTTRTCSDGLNCTTDLCDENTDHCVNTPVLGCTINGSCVAPGSDDPANSCRTCNPLLSTSAYSAKLVGSSCDDGLFCTATDICNGSGTCSGVARDCSDLLSCTNDSCNEASDQCLHAVSAGCAINGLCIPAGIDDPLNPCMTCNPAASTSAFTPKAVGTGCDDAQYCTTGDVCTAGGVCGGSARSCSDALACTTDTCNEILDVCVNTPSSGCMINGACVATGATDPSNPCLACNPAISAITYSPKSAGAACDDGQFCTQTDACNGLGLCTGTVRSCSDGLSCTTDVCNELSDLCVNTPALGCTINGACVAIGADDPTNTCRTCNPVLSATAYSPKIAGSACDDGLYCTATDACNGSGACTGLARDCTDLLTCTADTCDEATDQCLHPVSAGCAINGLCIPAGTDDPLNPCMTCNPGVSTSAFSPKTVGTGCDDAQFCTTGDTCRAGGVCGGNARSCSDALSCTTDSCNELLDLCVNTPSIGCTINGACVASGATDPSNPCMTCNPGVSAIAYTPKTAGVSCDDGQFCTQTDTCNGLGLCTGTARTCSDGLNCTTDVCNETTDQCVNTPTLGCTINGTCVAAGSDDPSNSCRTCNPALSTSAYSPKSFGSVCDDGLFCTGVDTCNGSGTCSGSARVCSDGLLCTTDSCNEATDQCVFTLAVGCSISGSCIAAGATDPANACMVCNPGLSTSVWSPRAAGASCDDGQYCTSVDTCNGTGLCTGSARSCDDGLSCTTDLCNELTDACVSTRSDGCLIAGACVPTGASDPSNACLACNPGSSVSGYTPRAAGANCDDGLFCTTSDRCNGSGACAGDTRSCDDGVACTSDTCDEVGNSCVHPQGVGCLIQGACVPAGAEDPTNACRACNPQISVSTYTAKTAGTACSDGLFCTSDDACNGAGACIGAARNCGDSLACTSDTCNETADTCVNVVASGCTVDGACIAEGAADPTNPCRSCIPSLSTTHYSLRPVGAACSDGLFCTVSDACNTLGVCTGELRSCGAQGGGCTQACDETADQCVAVASGCTIAGTCIASGTHDPTNACMVCDPLRSAVAFVPVATGSACSDGIFCTVGDTCNAEGVCGGNLRSCDDGLDCTFDDCDEDAHRCVSDGAHNDACVINNACVAAGAASPNNPCMLCVPSVSTTAYTAAPSGRACDDGRFCSTGDACTAEGTCAGVARDCGGGSACASSCDETNDVCRSDVSGCSVDGSCVSDGSPDPRNPCRTCNSGVNRFAYSALAAGTSCDDGLFCTVGDSCDTRGQCVGGARSCGNASTCDQTCDEAQDSCVSAATSCSVQGTCFAAGAQNPANPCEICDPSKNPSAFSVKPVGTSCSDGTFCTENDACTAAGLCAGTARSCDDGLACTSDSCDEASGRCRSVLGGGCTIDGACVAAGASDPNNPCRICQPSVATETWTNAPATQVCNDGLFCTFTDHCDGEGACTGGVAGTCGSSGGACATFCDETSDSCRAGVVGCSIDGACVTDGAAHPQDGCRWCDAAEDPFAWSLRPSGSFCSDGLYCTDGDTCNDAGACVGVPRVCSDALSCTSGTCNEALRGCEQDVQGGCAIDDTCVVAGAIDPSAPCHVCEPSLSKVSWSNVPAGTTCSDGQFCTSNDQCSAQGACVGGPAPCLGDSLGCTVESCDEATDRCISDVTNGCVVDGRCITNGTRRDADDACYVCNPNELKTAYSYVPDAVGCDSDHDGLRDSAELEPDGTEKDSDGDGRPDQLDPDDDDDGIPTRREFSDEDGNGLPDRARDLDEDGIPDYLDPDDDGDGRSTLTEREDARDYSDDVDGDGISNWYDTDSDGDGFDDIVENEGDGDDNDDGVPDYLQPNVTPRDDDHDGLTNTSECDGDVDNCVDSDGDGKPDYLDPDDDDDGVLTRYETRDRKPQDTDGDGIPDHLDPDDDEDGVPTTDEAPDPNGDGNPDDARDTDQNGVPDYLDPGTRINRRKDSNGNGIPDDEEGNVVPDGGVEEDAGEEPMDDGAVDDAGKRSGRAGGVSGSGLCSARPELPSNDGALVLFGAALCAAALRRRSRRARGLSAP